MTAERKEGKGKTEEQMPLEQVTAELWIQSRWKEHWGHREAKGWPLYWAPGPGMPPRTVIITRPEQIRATCVSWRVQNSFFFLIDV